MLYWLRELSSIILANPSILTQCDNGTVDLMQPHNREKTRLYGNLCSAILLRVVGSHIVASNRPVVVSGPNDVFFCLVLNRLAYSNIREFLNQTQLLIRHGNAVLFLHIHLSLLFVVGKVYQEILCVARVVLKPLEIVQILKKFENFVLDLADKESFLFALHFVVVRNQVVFDGLSLPFVQ